MLRHLKSLESKLQGIEWDKGDHLRSVTSKISNALRVCNSKRHFSLYSVSCMSGT
jgi:hypothetical protein